MHIGSTGRARGVGGGSLTTEADRSSGHPGVDFRRALLAAYLACFGLCVGMIALTAPTVWIEVGPALAIQAMVGVLLMLDAHLEGRSRSAVGMVALVAYLVSVALVRDGVPPSAGFGALTLLPVTWAALRGRRAEFVVAIVGMASVYLIPAALIGGSRYPSGSLRGGVLLTVIAAALGGMKLQLVHEVDGLMARLSRLAWTDELTGLPNRRAWHELLDRALASAQRTEQPLVVVLLDLDSFKHYNDTHGHLAADRLLRQIASAWTGILRECDVLARWGGDEFGLLLPACDQSQAFAVMERMRAACPEAPFSAGILESNGAETANELLARADTALYRVKDTRAQRKRPRADSDETPHPGLVAV